MPEIDRREFLQLAGLGGAVYASGLAGCATRAAGAADADFYFVQLSDSHWGFEGPPNPDAQVTLPKAVAAVNALAHPPDFVMFTGDLTHTTDDPAERRRRLARFREIVGGLKPATVHFMPGEHDASLDRGQAYIEFFGPTHYTFDHKGVHFIVLDNVSDPAALIGDPQLDWLAADLRNQPADAPIVVFTHRPLFDLYPQWDWATRDGARAIELLMPHPNVTVFYGHIHQEHHFMTGHIAHHAARSLIFACRRQAHNRNARRCPGTRRSRTAGLASAKSTRNAARRVMRSTNGRSREPDAMAATRRALLLATGASGLGLLGALVVAQPTERVVRIVAKKFDYTPEQLTLQVGQPVALELTSMDVIMGFNATTLGLRTDIVPGRITTLRFTPDKVGTHEFHCDVFCGSGHEDMAGAIVVTEGPVT